MTVVEPDNDVSVSDSHISLFVKSNALVIALILLSSLINEFSRYFGNAYFIN